MAVMTDRLARGCWCDSCGHRMHIPETLPQKRIRDFVKGLALNHRCADTQPAHKQLDPWQQLFAPHRAEFDEVR